MMSTESSFKVRLAFWEKLLVYMFGVMFAAKVFGFATMSWWVVWSPILFWLSTVVVAFIVASLILAIARNN